MIVKIAIYKRKKTNLYFYGKKNANSNPICL